MTKTRLSSSFLRQISFITITLTILCNFSSCQFSTFKSETQKKIVNGFNLNWMFVGEDVHLLIEKTSKGFMVLGLGTKGNKSDVIQIQKIGADGSSIEVKDCTFITKIQPVCSETSQDWTIVHQESSKDGFKVELKRKATSKDVSDDLNFVQGATNSMIWSIGTQNNVVKHEGQLGTNYGRFDLIMAPADTTNNSSSSLYTLWYLLSGFMLINFLCF